MKYKFLWNGIKEVETGKFFKCWFSKGGRLMPDGSINNDEITIYADTYQRLPKIEGLNIINDSDIMTDYFEKDRIEVFKENKFYDEVYNAWKLQEEHRIKLAIRYYEKEIKKTKERLDFYKGVDKYENYLNNILKKLISRLERAKAWKV